MFLLGLLGFFQIVFIPGQIVLRMLKFRGSLIQSLAMAFGISLVFNYVLVFLLTLLGIYRQGSMLIVVAIEVAALTWLFLPILKSPLVTSLRMMWNRLSLFFAELFPEVLSEDDNRQISQSVRSLLLIGFGILALSSVFWMVRVFWFNLGSVFEQWDAVVSWNFWAAGWAGNHLPIDMGAYPQLLPTNLSVAYVLQGGTQVQFFAKAVMPLFFLFILLLLFDLGLEKKTFGFFVAVVITRLMMKKFMGDYVADGYADFPVAFMSLLSIYLLIKMTSRQAWSEQRVGLFLGAVISAGAAVTKQAGIYTLILYPLFAYLFVIRPTPALSLRQNWRDVGYSFLLAVVIAFPWYFFYLIVGRFGVFNAQNWMAQGVYSWTTSYGLWEKLFNSFIMLDKYAFVILFLIPAMLVLPAIYRWMVILLIFPYTFFWASTVSYDARNLALAFPFIGLAAGVGIERFTEWVLVQLEKIHLARVKTAVVIILLLAGLAATARWFPAEMLESRQVEQQKRLFNPDLNEKIYEIVSASAADVKVLTDYPIRFLPGLEARQEVFQFTDLPSFELALQQPQVEYILIPVNSDHEILSYIDGRLKSGAYTLLFEDDRFIPYWFIQIN